MARVCSLKGECQKVNYFRNHLTLCKTPGPQTWVCSTTLWLLDHGPGKPTQSVQS